MAQAPLAPNQDSVLVTIRVVEKVADSFTELAQSQKISRSSLLREALAEYLERQGVAASA